MLHLFMFAGLEKRKSKKSSFIIFISSHSVVPPPSLFPPCALVESVLAVQTAVSLLYKSRQTGSLSNWSILPRSASAMVNQQATGVYSDHSSAGLKVILKASLCPSMLNNA